MRGYGSGPRCCDSHCLLARRDFLFEQIRILNLIPSAPAIANYLTDQLCDQLSLIEEVAKTQKDKFILILHVRDPELLTKIEAVIRPDLKKLP
jgi:hypothetical protein